MQLCQTSWYHWRRFWTEGGAVELGQSKDPRAHELERRVVLSQYLTAIQCSGSRPPQETGLTVNSWYGKFHLEMHWWHAAHFALWNRLPLLEKSLGWYNKILPVARQLANSQGYAGARWPKMVGPEGRDSPSTIGPLVDLATTASDLLCRTLLSIASEKQTLERYHEIVFESATSWRRLPFVTTKTHRYVLGPPLIPAQENHPPSETWNPTFELAYWRDGLKHRAAVARTFGNVSQPVWDRVIEGFHLYRLGTVFISLTRTVRRLSTERNHDHPSMLGALGVLAGRRSGSRNDAPHAFQRHERVEVGPDVGLGLSADGYDGSATG